MNKQYSFIKDFELECGTTLNIGVNYCVFGRYYPATLEQPEEFPEMEIVEVENPFTHFDLSDTLSPNDMERLIDMCWNHFESEGEY